MTQEILCGPRAGTQKNGAVREPEAPRQSTSEEVHLIEATFERPLTVQRNGDNDIRGHALGFPLHYPGKEPRKPRAERFNVFMLKRRMAWARVPL